MKASWLDIHGIVKWSVGVPDVTWFIVIHKGGLERDTSKTYMYSKHHQRKPIQSGLFTKGLFHFELRLLTWSSRCYLRWQVLWMCSSKQYHCHAFQVPGCETTINTWYEDERYVQATNMEEDFNVSWRVRRWRRFHSVGLCKGKHEHPA